MHDRLVSVDWRPFHDELTKKFREMKQSVRKSVSAIHSVQSSYQTVTLCLSCIRYKIISL